MMSIYGRSRLVYGLENGSVIDKPFQILDDKITRLQEQKSGQVRVGSILLNGMVLPLFSSPDDIELYLKSRKFEFCFVINRRATLISEGFVCQFYNTAIIQYISANTFVRGSGVDWAEIFFKSTFSLGNDITVRLFQPQKPTLRYDNDAINQFKKDLASCGDVTSVYTDNSCFYDKSIGFINHTSGHAAILSRLIRNFDYPFAEFDVESVKEIFRQELEIVVFPSVKRKNVIEFKCIYKQSLEFFKDLLLTDREICVYTLNGAQCIRSIADINQLSFQPSGRHITFYFEFV